MTAHRTTSGEASEPRVPGMARTLAVAFVFLTMLVGEAQATTFRVVVVPGLELSDLQDLQERGAVGLLVPGAGPETSADRAFAALERGEVRNSLRGGSPEGSPVIAVETADEVPSGNVIVLALPQGGDQANNRRYPVAVIGPGFEGLLESDSTRIPGLVSIADIAPTALGRDDGLASEPNDDAAAELRELDRRISENNDARLPATLLAAVIILVLAFAWPRAALIGFATGLGANLFLGVLDVSEPWIVLVVIAAAVAVAAPLLALVLRSGFAVGAALVAVLAAYLVVLGVDGPSVALSPFGPTQNARFYGISNLLGTFFLVPALAGAALLARRFGAAGFAFAAAIALLLVAGSRFGADGGGAIVLAVGFTVLAVLLARARPRVIAVAGVASLALVAAFVAVDAATGGSSHVTRAFEDGPAGLASDLAERVELSLARLADNVFVAVLVTAGVAVLVFLVARTLRSDAPLPTRAAPLALAAAIAASLIVNDSPNDVVLGGVVGYLAVERGMLSPRCVARSWFSRLRSRSPVAAAPSPSPPPRRP
jgi:hypothetical protein